MLSTSVNAKGVVKLLALRTKIVCFLMLVETPLKYILLPLTYAGTNDSQRKRNMKNHVVLMPIINRIILLYSSQFENYLRHQKDVS